MDFISFKINDGLDCNVICSRVQKLINDYVESGKIIDNSYIDIRISNATSFVNLDKPKIEQH